MSVGGKEYKSSDQTVQAMLELMNGSNPFTAKVVAVRIKILTHMATYSKKIMHKLEYRKIDTDRKMAILSHLKKGADLTCDSITMGATIPSPSTDEFEFVDELEYDVDISARPMHELCSDLIHAVLDEVKPMPYYHDFLDEAVDHLLKARDLGTNHCSLV